MSNKFINVKKYIHGSVDGLVLLNVCTIIHLEILLEIRKGIRDTLLNSLTFGVESILTHKLTNDIKTKTISKSIQCDVLKIFGGNVC